jgi:hypothetical protein
MLKKNFVVQPSSTVEDKKTFLLKVFVFPQDPHPSSNTRTLTSSKVEKKHVSETDCRHRTDFYVIRLPDRISKNILLDFFFDMLVNSFKFLLSTLKKITKKVEFM